MFNLVSRRFPSPLSLLDDSFFNFPSAPTLTTFKLDVAEKEDKYLISAELPGYEKSNIEVKFEKGLVSITASKKEETNEETPNYIHKESFSGQVTRQIYFEDVDEGKAEAKYENGILTIELPKLESSRERKIDIR